MQKLLEFLNHANRDSGIQRYYYREHLPLSEISTFRIGGPADVAVYPADTEALASLCRFLAGDGIPYRVIGNASNLLFSDAGYRGAIILTGRLCRMVYSGTALTADAGVQINRLCMFALSRGVSGFENFYGIPGTVGGAAVMNGGAFGTSFCEIATDIDALNTESGETRSFATADAGFGSRTSLFLKDKKWVVLSAVFRTQNERQEVIETRMRQNMLRRRASQPLEFPSAGSVFKRPEGHYAGVLIEEAGLKGRRIGGAEVSEKHAGFIINRNHATSLDVLTLIETIRTEVERRHGLRLECEVEYIPEE